MRMAHKFCRPLLMIVLMAGCAHESDVQEIDANAFVRFFVAQSKCRAYINVLIDPVVGNLSLISMPEDMRSWISEHAGGDFSDMVIAVREATVGYGPIDPTNELDQLKVADKLSLILGRRSDYNEACDTADSMEIFMDLLYLRLGGNESIFVKEFRRRGINDSWNQKWILATTLLAGSLKQRK